MENNNKVVLRHISIYTCLGLCNPSYCLKHCSDFIKVEKQQEINEKLLQSNDHQIRNFIIENVKKVETNKWDYYLEGLQVCCRMFCNTIGHKRPDNIQNFVLKSGIDKRYIKRSNHWKTHSNEFNNKIKDFLMSFEPQKSHYKLESCPNRLYIPSEYDLNPITCYLKFCEKMNFLPKINNKSEDQLNRNGKRESNEPEVCNYEYFDKIRKKLNVHFDNNCSYFCTFCNEHSIHHNSKYSEKLCDCLCNLCQRFKIHIKNANESRNLMRKDSKTAENRNDSKVILSADMQKSLLFPIIHVKDNYFTEKLTLFNQTFAELGKSNDALCLISFDAEISKGANEFVNFHLQVLKSPKYSDKKSITFYVDNCYYQNKNYILFANLLLIINDPIIAFDQILFIYLEKGHTYMSADGIHGDITRQMRKHKNIYTFDQFVKVIENSRKKFLLRHLHIKISLYFKEWKNRICLKISS